MPATAARRTIARDELKARLDRGVTLRLVMTLSEWDYGIKHIPGSICLSDPREILARLDPADEIVIYGAHEADPHAIGVQRLLESRGYEHVARYAGGIVDWEAAGLPLEGREC
jgi:rhodanese-related sulfurtransferase